VKQVDFKGKWYTDFEPSCPECQSLMRLRPSKKGVFYGCSRWPSCPGTAQAHSDGRPKDLADAKTRRARAAARAVFEQLWESPSNGLSKTAAQAWVRDALKLPANANLDTLSEDECLNLVQTILHAFPDIQSGGVWGHSPFTLKFD
jgi:ssDNA-binding Zn-finger/Zn-ribbon topoisomerase 1